MSEHVSCCVVPFDVSNLWSYDTELQGFLLQGYYALVGEAPEAYSSVCVCVCVCVCQSAESSAKWQGTECWKKHYGCNMMK